MSHRRGKVARLRAVPPPPDEDLVRYLEKLLAEAKRGELQGLVAFTDYAGTASDEALKGTVRPRAAIGSLHCLIAKLVAMSDRLGI